MVPSLPRLPLAAALVLLAAAPAARATFQPGAIVDLGADLRLNPRGAVGLEDGTLLVFDGGPPCRICAGGETKAPCDHPWQPRLVHLRRMDGGAGAREAWKARPVCSLEPTVGGILGVQGGAVYLNETIYGVIRVPLLRQRGHLRAGAGEVVLGIPHLLALGIPFGCAPNLALTGDGGLVLAFDDGVGLLPARADWSDPESLRWLLGKPPTKPLPPGIRPALLPAVAADGTLFVVDRSNRAVFRFAAGDRKLSVVAKGGGWPGPAFVPILPAAHGDLLLVCGQDLGLGTAALAALAPGEAPGTWPVQPLDLALGLSESIRFTPGGDLLVTDLRRGGLRLVRARTAGGPAETKGGAGAGPETKGDTGAGPETQGGAKAETKAGAGTELKAGLSALPAAARPLEPRDPASGPEGPGAKAKEPALRPVDKSDRLAIGADTLAFAESKDFDRAFAQWARPLGGAGVAPDESGLSPALNPFSLGYGGLKQVVRWMLRNADEANHPADMAEWQEAGRPDRPRFSFGLYRHYRHAGVVLEIYDLDEYVPRIDGQADGGRVAGELGPAGGMAGFRRDREGVPRDYRGITVTLGPDHRSLVSIHPGGAPDPMRQGPDGEDPKGPPTGTKRK
jgi:hypothetical protein